MVMPPEWHPQDWLWIGFPHDPVEWPGFLLRAQDQITAFANAVAESGQEVRLLVRDEANEARARQLVSARVTLERRRYGDIWLRDTGPLVVPDGSGGRKAMRFGFNGWGGKYLMDGAQTIGAELSRDAGLEVETADWVLEGGAVDGDGTGLVVTTEQCLLHPNRNPQLSREEIEQRLARDLGFSRVLWLGEGLVNDHTDGHVDNLARFVGPNELALPLPQMPGSHQGDNAALAVAMLRHQGEVTVSPTSMAEGIRSAVWPARLQVLGDGPLTLLLPDRTFLLDGGHNPDAALAMAQYLATRAPKPVDAIVGMLSAKDARTTLGIIAPHLDTLTAIPIEGSEYHPLADLAAMAEAAGTPKVHTADSIEDAIRWIGGLQQGGERREGTVLIAGSLYLAGNVLRANGDIPD